MPFGMWTEESMCSKLRRGEWEGASPREKAFLGGHTWACPDLPVIDILNVIRQGASAMATSVLQQLVFNLTGLWQLQLVGHLLDLATYKQKSNA